MPLALWILALLCWKVGAAPVPDLVVFDEDDPLGGDYYDASVCVVKRPSTLRLLARTGDKIPVSTNAAFRGRVGGVIDWRSRREGDWAIHVFRPGFPLLDVSRYEAIEFVVNAPTRLRREAMPRLELQDLRGRVVSAALGTFVESGLDSDTNTWQRVRVPTRALQGDRDWAPDRVKHISFRQGAAD